MTTPSGGRSEAPRRTRTKLHRYLNTRWNRWLYAMREGRYEDAAKAAREACGALNSEVFREKKWPMWNQSCIWYGRQQAALVLVGHKFPHYTGRYSGKFSRGWRSRICAG